MPPHAVVINGVATASAPGFFLAGASKAGIFTHANTTYAAVTSQVGGGVQVIDLSDPSTPINTAFAVDGPVFRHLRGATGISIFYLMGTSGPEPYAIVASQTDNGVQVISFADPANPAAAVSAASGTGLWLNELDGAYGVATWAVDTSTYASARREGEPAPCVAAAPACPRPLPRSY